MGYFSFNNQSITIDEPKEVTLANSPNFITIKSANTDQPNNFAKIKLYVNRPNLLTGTKSEITITIKEQRNNNTHTFIGTYDKDTQKDNSFIINELDPTIPIEMQSSTIISTANNLRTCLMKEDYIRNNFNISILPQQVNEYNDNNNYYAYFWGGTVIELTAKEAGNKYNCEVDISHKTIEDDSKNKWNIGDQYKIQFNIEDCYITGLPIYLYWILEPHNENMPVLRPLRVIQIEGVENPKNNQFKIALPDEKTTIKQATLETLTSLKSAMERIDDITQKFELSLDPDNLAINIKYTKGDQYGTTYSGRPILSKDQYNPNTYQISHQVQHSTTTDNIGNVDDNIRLEADIYTNTGITWGGQNDHLNASGTYLTTLSKTYFGQALWFDLNALMSKRISYSPYFLSLTHADSTTAQWVDTGTIADYRVTIRRTNEYTNTPIYISQPLYVINGYNYTLDNATPDNHIDQYIVDLNNNNHHKAKPLTDNTTRTHIRGQKQYYNFLLKRKTAQSQPLLALKYTLYTQSHRPIAQYIEPYTDAATMHTANTTLLNLDQFLPTYNNKTVGYIQVTLVTPQDQQTLELTQAITYHIQPHCLHTVRDYAYLNRLGGWDTFNFGANKSVDFKTTTTTYYKTLTPGFTPYTQIESVSAKTVSEQHTVQTTPIDLPTVETLREISTSHAVYELSTRRYILVDDLALKYNHQDNLFQVEMKYHYTDKYNGQMQ